MVSFELHFAIAQANGTGDLQRLFGTIQQGHQHGIVHLFNGRIQIMAEGCEHGFHLFEDPRALIAAKRHDRATLHAFPPVRNKYSGATSVTSPKPLHLGQAPYGELKLNKFGSGSSYADSGGGAHQVPASE